MKINPYAKAGLIGAGAGLGLETASQLLVKNISPDYFKEDGVLMTKNDEAMANKVHNKKGFDLEGLAYSIPLGALAGLAIKGLSKLLRRK